MRVSTQDTQEKCGSEPKDSLPGLHALCATTILSGEEIAGAEARKRFDDVVAVHFDETGDFHDVARVDAGEHQEARVERRTIEIFVCEHLIHRGDEFAVRLVGRPRARREDVVDDAGVGRRDLRERRERKREVRKIDLFEAVDVHHSVVADEGLFERLIEVRLVFTNPLENVVVGIEGSKQSANRGARGFHGLHILFSLCFENKKRPDIGVFLPKGGQGYGYYDTPLGYVKLRSRNP